MRRKNPSPLPRFEIPSDLEEVVVRKGPRILAWAIRMAEGTLGAAKVAGVSPATLIRWRDNDAMFRVRGPGVRSYHSMWAGYPPPFPGLDRILEELVGPSENFLHAYTARFGLATGLRRIRTMNFGICELGFSSTDALEVSDGLGMPRTTGRRCFRDCIYPLQWRGLDRLTSFTLGAPFLESTLLFDPPTVCEPIPKEALTCLVSEICCPKISALTRS